MLSPHTWEQLVCPPATAARSTATRSTATRSTATRSTATRSRTARSTRATIIPTDAARAVSPRAPLGSAQSVGISAAIASSGTASAVGGIYARIIRATGAAVSCASGFHLTAATCSAAAATCGNIIPRSRRAIGVDVGI
jgi:hypothetical protein